MAEDDNLALNVRLIVVNTIPNSVFFLVIVPVHIPMIRRNSASMHQDIGLAVDLYVDIQRQAVELIEDLFADRLPNVLDILVSDVPAVSIPQSKGVGILWIIFVKPVQGVQHHIFVIAQEHLNIGQIHQQAQYPDSVRVAINDISEDIERVLRLKIDLLHNGVESDGIAVDIRHHIDHRSSSSPIFEPLQDPLPYSQTGYVPA